MPRRDIKTEIADRLENLVDELYDMIAEAAADAVQEALGTVRTSTRGRATKKRATKKRATKKRATKKRATKKRATKKRSTKKRATKKRSTKKRSAKKAGRRARRSSADVEATSKAIASQLRKTPGVSVSDLANSMGADSADLKRPLALMLEAGSIRKTGEKRGTKYFAKGRK